MKTYGVVAGLISITLTFISGCGATSTATGDGDSSPAENDNFAPAGREGDFDDCFWADPDIYDDDDREQYICPGTELYDQYISQDDWIYDYGGAILTW